MWKIAALRLLMVLEKSPTTALPIAVLVVAILYNVFSILARPQAATVDKVMLIIILVVVMMTVCDWVGMTRPYKFPGDDYDPTLTVDTYEFIYWRPRLGANSRANRHRDTRHTVNLVRQTSKSRRWNSNKKPSTSSRLLSFRSSSNQWNVSTTWEPQWMALWGVHWVLMTCCMLSESVIKYYYYASETWRTNKNIESRSRGFEGCGIRRIFLNTEWPLLR